MSTHLCKPRYDAGMSARNESLRAWLWEQLRVHEWTRADFARAVGIDPAQVSRWMNGKDLPSRDSAIRIARLFDVHPNYVLELAGYETVPDVPIDLSDPLISFAAINQHRLTSAQKRAMIEMAKQFLGMEESKGE